MPTVTSSKLKKVNQSLQKRIGISILILVAILVLAFASFGTKNKERGSLSGKGESGDVAAQILSIEEKLPPSEDTDGDGSLNWQETIRGTDPNKKDENIPTQTISSNDLKRLSDESNMTVALAKNNATLSAYLNTLENKADVDQKGLAEDILISTAASFSFKRYEESDLTNKIEPTQTKRKEYGNSLAKATAEMAAVYSQFNDLSALKDIVNEVPNSPSVFFLKKKIEAVEVFKKTLLTMPVPKDVVPLHLSFVNAVSSYGEVLNGFLNQKEDPLKAGLFLRGYKDITENLFINFDAISPYFSGNNLTFSAKDPGYVFTVGVFKNDALYEKTLY